MMSTKATHNLAPVSRRLRPISTVDALAQEVSSRILSGEIAPGTPLRETQLATEYGVGRNTVRAALHRLAHEGLLQRELNRGVSVPELTHEDVRDLYWIRAILEEAVVRKLAGERVRPDEAFAELRQFEALPVDTVWDRVVEADMAIHRALVRAVGSERLDRLYALIAEETRLCIAELRTVYASAEELALEHRQLLGAIATGEVDRAVRTMRAHLQKGLEDIVKRQPDGGAGS